MNVRNILTVGSMIALALVVVPSMAAAQEPNVSVDDLPPTGDPGNIDEYLAKKCTEALQQVQPGRRCYVQ